MASVIVNPPFPQQSGSAPYFGVRAWVNFNGTGTVAVRASGNVSSVTRNNTGDYTINFTTALPNANYSVLSNVNSIAPAVNVQGLSNLQAAAADGSGITKTTTACRIVNGISSNGTATDFGQVSVAFIG
jgi:hypothetical protein